MMIAKAAIPCSRNHAKIAWCAHMTDAPDDINMVMSENGISQGMRA